MTDIRTIRHALKMTQRELAELTWRSDAATISDWETGKSKCPQHVYQRLLKMIQRIEAPAGGPYARFIISEPDKGRLDMPPEYSPPIPLTDTR